ncbi:unnamed protein product (macronuclear) [Paramecium tetraurelia]|uniref:Ubiquitin-like domain-containing protein n=1 Tax=Paramecium tetraurelia TaxID=5888 RepID=A0DD30_PARTE|nr:uncharacterized protein GSPATT00015806001 [Paramecium tetraurelia]CAK80947.1 unnamed protein product [Paramecium tetraurelia]|eukprot:XP_001448344.1 hypothetical protein (macronuclear) [Paramecium tetraurelia strain d4-2]
MSKALTIEILPSKQTLSIEMDPDTEIHELFEYIQQQNDINSDIRNWTCYSYLKRVFLNHNSRIGNAENDKLTINTQPTSQSITPQSDLINTSNKIPNTTNYQQSTSQGQQQQQQFGLQNQTSNQNPQQVTNLQYPQNQTYQNNNYSQQQYSGLVQSQMVTIHFSIIDGNIKREFKSGFKSDDRLEDLADAVLAYLGASKQWAACDLVIYGQNYNTGAKREKTLQQLSIKSDATIEARLRWIGGSEY